MSIPLPTLDDRTYDDLLDEARSLIPSLAPQWTNHNPSDPGITLIELFAWLTEMLIYRVDRLPKANTVAFLRLLNGPQWSPGLDLDEEIRTAVLDLRRRSRAVTAEDYEALACAASPGVARARCVPRRNLAEKTEAGRLAPRDGTVSVVVLPDPGQAGAVDPASREGAPLPAPGLLSVVSDDLQPRRLITVRQVVAPPVYVPVQAELVVAARPDAPAALRALVVTALTGFLDPLTGGPEGEGWPFGRAVYVSELYRLLEREAPGVDYVPDITLSSTCPERAPFCIAGNGLWNEDGDPVGIELAAHHLPWPQIDPARIAIGSAFLPVRVAIDATADASVEPAAARRAAKTAVKLLFHPLHGGPGGDTRREVTTGEIANHVASLPEIATVTRVVLTADSARLYGDGASTRVRFLAGEMADVTVKVQV